MSAGRRRSTLVVLLLMAVGTLLAACSDEDPTGPPPEELPGIWIATESEFVRVASPSERVEIIGQGGQVTLGLLPDGQFFLTLILPGELQPWIREGAWRADWDLLRLEYQVGGGGVNEFDMDWQDNVLSLRGADSLFDFGAGIEDAKWNLRMVKQTSG